MKSQKIDPNLVFDYKLNYNWSRFIFCKIMQHRTCSPEIYYVTYSVLNSKAGANPFGHACLIFSKTHESAIQVEKAYGYYSQPSSTTNPCLKWVKKILGIKYDLQHTHAALREEKMRDLIGDGIKGISFSISAAQYQAFLQEFAQRLEQQDAVIADLDAALEQEGVLPTGVARYDLQNRRGVTSALQKLKPFHLHLGFNHGGRSASTCKQLALEALEAHDIINPSQRQRLEHRGGVRYPFPIFSGQALAPIRFHAQGPLQEETSAKGKKYYNPTFSSNQLFWSLPVYVGGDNLTQIKTLAREFKSIPREYNKIRQKLYSVNANQPHEILTKMIEELEQQAKKLEHLDASALEGLASLVNIAKGVLNKNYYKSQVWQRMLNHPGFILHLGILFLSLGLTVLFPQVNIVVPLILATIGIFLQAMHSFLPSEKIWRQSKREYYNFLSGFSADVQQSLPGLLQGLRN